MCAAVNFIFVFIITVKILKTYQRRFCVYCINTIAVLWICQTLTFDYMLLTLRDVYFRLCSMYFLCSVQNLLINSKPFTK